MSGTHESAEQFEAPVDLTGFFSLTRLIEMGEQIEDLLEHPGYKALCEVLGICSEDIAAQLMARPKPYPDAASYADKVGEMRGLRKIGLIARGVIHTGKEAAAQKRADEERGSP